MNKQQKFVDVIINPDGSVAIDQIGFEGKSCSGEVEDLVRILGVETQKNKKPEYYKQQKVKINQHLQ